VLRFELNDRGQLRARHERQLGLPLRASKPVNPMKERVIDIHPAEIVSDKSG
jgi:hypothetical protein